MFETREREYESAEEPEEGEDQTAIENFEANAYDLSGIDEKNAEEISNLAAANFDRNPTGWTKLLKEASDLIDEYRKGEHDDEEFTGLLQDKLTEAHDLTPN